MTNSPSAEPLSTGCALCSVDNRSSCWYCPSFIPPNRVHQRQVIRHGQRINNACSVGLILFTIGYIGIFVTVYATIPLVIGATFITITHKIKERKGTFNERV